MPTRVGWGPGVEEWKLHLWEFWKRCVSLKWASVQHTQKINSLPSSHLSESPPGLSQEILHKGSLFVHPFYNENAFVDIFNIWKQFSKIYIQSSLVRVHWTSSVWNRWAQQQQRVWRMVEWMHELCCQAYARPLEFSRVFHWSSLVIWQHSCITATEEIERIFGLLCSKPCRPQSLERLSSSLVQQSVFSMGPRGRTLEQPRASLPRFTFWLCTHSLDLLGNFKSGLWGSLAT